MRSPYGVVLRGGRFLTLVLALMLFLLVVSTGAAGPGRSGVEVQSAVEAPTTVTLFTGDRVTAYPGGGVSVEPGEGRENITFLTTDGGGEIQVVPSDLGYLLSRGQLDARLLDIDYLIAQDLDDNHTDRLPLLIEGSTEQIREAASGAGAAITRELPRIKVSAVTQERGKNAGKLWSRLAEPKSKGRGARTHDIGAQSSGSTSRPAGAEGDASLVAGVEKVWLDETLHVALDQSVPQIGAPEAWEAGYDGDGVKVAVLDSGIDTSHPDLSGRVTAASNFTFEPSAADGNGHGTHVASTIAGSGAAAGGRYRGVAPGASLLNGKVCNSAGECPTSWVLAGMQWAVANGADVVNMSLGGEPTDGTDPLSQAVNTLTASSGALFVIAAGNSGPDAYTVGSPGAADAALTVGAVTKTDQLAEFSSRGPRIGNHAIKPDIAAPGVGIVAARASGTSAGDPVDDRYTSLNGTSMATPHVAGAAAILAQRHPAWTADRLKSGLMSSARALPNVSPFAVGTGRLDVARAITQDVTATPTSLSFGLVPWPHEAPGATKAVTYRNDGDSPLTLALTLSVTDEDGVAAPAGLFSLDAHEVVVPANGAATVQVAMTPQARQAGDYGGLLTAMGAGTLVRTAVGVVQERESYSLTVNLLDRNGQAPTDNDTFSVFGYATSETYSFLPSGRTLRLPAGEYGVVGYVTTPRPDVRDNRFGRLDDVAELVYPRVRLDQETVVTLDARQAHEVEMTVDRSDARLRTMTLNSGFKILPENGNVGYFHFALSTWDPFTATGRNAYIGSFGGSSDMYVHLVQAILEKPLIQLEVNGPQGFPVDVAYAGNAFDEGYSQVPTKPLLGKNRMDVVVVGDGTAGELSAIDVRGKLVVVTSPETQDATLLDRVAGLRQAGARAVLLDRSPLERPFLDAAAALPIVLAADPQRSRLVDLARTRGASVTTTGVVASPYQYNLLLPTEGRIPEDPVFHLADSELGSVTVDYRGSAPPLRAEYRHAVFLGRSWASGLRFLSVTSDPIRRTEFYSPGPVRWQRETTYGFDGPTRRTEPAEFPAGSATRETQFGGVVGPSLSTPPLTNTFAAVPRRPAWAFRDGETMDIAIPLLADETPGHVMLTGDIRPGFARLFRDGTLVAESPRPGIVKSTVPTAAARYRLEAGLNRFPTLSGAWWELSSTVTAAWTFDSAETSSPSALPLMTVRYEPQLNEYNQAPAGKRFEFPVRVDHQIGARNSDVRELTVESSTDGQNWQPVRLVRTGKQWRAALTNPVEGFVSLRANATDADGNTVEQTIQHAYGIAETRGGS